MMLKTNHYDNLSKIFFVGIAALFLVTCRDYGYSWDEVLQNRQYGKAVLRYYLTFGADREALDSAVLNVNGGLFDAMAEGLVFLLPLDAFFVRRLANLFMGLLASAGAWQIARMVAGARAGFWTLLILMAIPVWYGHSFINAKDIPFAAGYIWSLYWILKFTRGLPDVPLRTIVMLGLSMGLALGIRVGGLLVAGYLLLIAGCILAGRLVATKGAKDLSASNHGLYWKLPLALLIAATIMAMFWPRVLVDPVGGINNAIAVVSRFPWRGNVLFNGRYVLAPDLPWTYLPVYFAVKLPVPILLLFVMGIIRGLTCVIRSARRREWRAVCDPGLLLTAALLPPMYAIWKDAVIYDGIRHFLFILPPMACLAGAAMAQFMAALEKRQRYAAAIVYGGLVIYSVYHARVMTRLHPFQYAYLNVLAGGMPAGAEYFETEYWITSYKEAASKMVAFARSYSNKEGIPFDQRRFKVVVAGTAVNVGHMVPQNFIVVPEGSQENADFYIGTSRWGMDEIRPQWETIAKVERMGMLFAVVKTSLPSLKR